MTYNAHMKNVRVTLYLEEDKYLKLKSILILKKMSVSEWVRIQVDKFMEKHNA